MISPASPELVAALRSAGCVWAEDEASVIAESATDDVTRWELARRRMAGEPLEQVVGWARFCGRRIAVSPGVFVPRRRSEVLARVAVDEVDTRAPAVVVDLCCGAGALAVAIASGTRPGSIRSLHAADVDPRATACAEANLAPFGGRVYLGDLFDALPPELCGSVDVLVVNAPYVPTGSIATLPAEAREHEHPVALDGGPDGVDVHRRIAAGVWDWLRTDGVVLVETSDWQADATMAVLAGAGLVTDCVVDDDVVVARGRRVD